MADDNTTGHVWDDDLREMNNPLPRWWMCLFVITVVFAAVYLALYPGLGKFRRHAGLEQRRPVRGRAGRRAGRTWRRSTPSSRRKTAEELAKDQRAMGIGERLFVNNCAQCHGSDARGSKGFPNLTDGDWLYGGTLRDDRRDHHQRPHRHDAADGRGGGQRPRTCATSPTTC